MLAGDVLVMLGGDDMRDLRVFSEKLKTFEPGQSVRARYIRDGVQTEVDIELVER